MQINYINFPFFSQCRQVFSKKKTEARADSSPDPSSARKISRGKAKNPFPQKKRFSLCRVRISPRHTARILGGQNTEEKTPFPFSKEISPPPNQESKECFSFGVAEALRGSGGAIHSRSKKVRANAKITPPNETCSELRKGSDLGGEKSALSIFSKPLPPTAEAVNSQSSPQLHE